MIARTPDRNLELGKSGKYKHNLQSSNSGIKEEPAESLVIVDQVDQRWRSSAIRLIRD